MMRSRSRSRSPRRRRSPGHSRSSYSNGESSRTAGDRCSHCMQSFRRAERHNPGPEEPLPDRETLLSAIVNPHGTRPEGGRKIPIEEVQIPRRLGEGAKPLFGFMTPRRVVIVKKTSEERNPVRSSSNPRDSRFDRNDRRGDGSRRPPTENRPARGDEREGETRRKEREERDQRERDQRERDRRERLKKEEDARIRHQEQKATEPPKEEAPPSKETHENGAPSHRPWRPAGPPIYYPPHPHGYPPMGPPPPWGPYPPPRPFLPIPRPGIRRPPRY